MKQLILTLCALLAMPAMAISEERMKLCKAIGEFAETAMTRRQDGTEITTLLEAISDNPKAQKIVIQAYKVPKYQTAAYQLEAIESFKNDYLTTCFSATE